MYIVKFGTPNNRGNHALQVPNRDSELVAWLKKLVQEVSEWFAKAEAGDFREFEGLNGVFWLEARLAAAYGSSAVREVMFDEPGRSNDTRNSLRIASAGVYSTISDRKEDWAKDKAVASAVSLQRTVFRILIVDFSLADSDAYSWLSWPSIARRMDEVVKMLADRAGPPLPYDAVIPAVLDKRHDRECCFGKTVILDQEREAEIRTLVKSSGLDQECPPPKLEPWLRESIIALTETSEVFIAQLRRPMIGPPAPILDRTL